MPVTLEMITICKSLYGTPGSFRGSKICAKSSYAYHHHHMLPKKMKRGKKGKCHHHRHLQNVALVKGKGEIRPFQAKNPHLFYFSIHKF